VVRWLALIAVGGTACGRVDFDPRPVDAPASGLLLWLRFEEAGSSFVDASGHGNDGSCSGTTCPTVERSAREGTGAARFDGIDDLVTIADAPDLDVAAITVALWANKHAHDMTGDNDALIGRQYGSVERDVWSLGYFPQPGVEYMWALSTASVEPSERFVSGRSSNGDLETWVHLAATHDGQRSQLYVDGVLVNEVPTVGDLYAETTPIIIGAGENGVRSEFSSVTIDDLRIYDHVLTPGQIAVIAAP